MKPLHITCRSVAMLGVALTLLACGTNPVTGKREIQFVSKSQEISIGGENYAPMRQAEGGDYNVLPELTAYVNEVGRKLVAVDDTVLVKDRNLPFEFTVLNNSVPNAWALPGGKIAVNRGLLTELNSEAELAAVLGHEIVHALARHGAQAQERGTLLQGGLAAAQIGAAIGGVDQTTAGLVLGGAGVGAQLITMRYGRDAELQGRPVRHAADEGGGLRPGCGHHAAGNLREAVRRARLELAGRPVRLASAVAGARGEEPRNRGEAGRRR